MKLREAINTKKQGDIGLGIAISYFASQGLTVCIPLTDSQDYDLIVDRGDRLVRVQVKTVFRKSIYGRYVVTLRTRGGNRSGAGKTKFFDQQKCDELFVYADTGEIYLIPVNCIACRSTITLGEKWKQFRVGGAEWRLQQTVNLSS